METEIGHARALADADPRPVQSPVGHCGVGRVGEHVDGPLDPGQARQELQHGRSDAHGLTAGLAFLQPQEAALCVHLRPSEAGHLILSHP